MKTDDFDSPDATTEAAAIVEEKVAAFRQKRGTPFPQVSLAEAARIIREIGSYGTDHSVVALASYMGHESAVSGPFRQKLAAFRDWQLLRGTGDRLSLTDLGLRLAHPLDDAAERAALRQAFQNAPIFQQIYENSAKNRDLDLNAIGNLAVTTYGIQPKLKERFIESFKESVIVAGLAVETEEGKIRFTTVEHLAESLDDKRLHSAAATPGTIKPSAELEQNVRRGMSPVLQQTWDFGTGNVALEIRSTRPLTATDFAQVAKTVEEIEKLALQLRRGEGNVTE